jgi:hypothetical protein
MESFEAPLIKLELQQQCKFLVLQFARKPDCLHERSWLLFCEYMNMSRLE